MTAATWDLTASQIERFRRFASRQFGLRFEDGQLSYLAEILRRQIQRADRFPDGYLADLEVAGLSRAGDIVRNVVQELTITETYFFRHIEQFRAFREIALPERIAARSRERCLRILSAGCASGEEPYSLAILLRDFPDTIGWDVTIQGIDLNVAGLEKAARARYSTWALRETPPEVQARAFRAEGRDLVLDASIRSMVTFGERNLSQADPAFWQPAVFDVVFCRNVLMYFTPDAAQAAVDRLASSLVPGGFLFMGFAENLRGLSQDFHLRHTHGTFYYQRRSDSERSRARPTATSWSEAVALHPSSVVAPLPAPTSLALSDNSWVETIRRASDRVHSLTSAPAPPADVPRVPDVGTPSGSPRPPWDLRETIDLIRQERFGEAGALLESLPAASDRDPDVMLLKAVLLTHGGDLAAAEKQCEKVLEIDSMSAGAHYLAALCREGVGDRDDAAEHDRVAAYLDPAFAMPRLHLGLLARRAGHLSDARRDLGEALILLQREDASRLLLFAGGFSREALMALCRAELTSCGGVP